MQKKNDEIVANKHIDNFVCGMKRRETFEEKEDKLPVYWKQLINFMHQQKSQRDELG